MGDPTLGSSPRCSTATASPPHGGSAAPYDEYRRSAWHIGLPVDGRGSIWCGHSLVERLHLLWWPRCAGEGAREAVRMSRGDGLRGTPQAQDIPLVSG